MIRLAAILDRINRSLGRTIAWGVILLILIQAGLVVAQTIFRENDIRLNELLLYINALIFLGCAGYALAEDEHVRVDLFYRDAPERAKAEVDVIGTTLFLIPICVLLWWAGLPYVRSSWAIGETSIEATGLPLVWLLKSFILLFAAVLSLQAVALLARSFARLSIGPAER